MSGVGEAIAAAAELWIDTPFHWQGQVRGVGCDCRGLISGVARECGRPEADSLEALAGDYGYVVPIARLKQGMIRLFDRVSVSQRLQGDLLLLKLCGKPQHLAIFAPRLGRPDRAIEAMPSGPGKVRPATWRADRIDSVWRWRELSDLQAGVGHGC